jgi:4-hydroxy-2-oxoheptanedioate aldolase
MKTLQEMAGSSDTAIGTWISLADPCIVEFVKWAEFDFVCIDNEYFPFSPDMLGQMIMTANNLQIPLIIRISRMEDISTLINFGANGIMIPDCTFERAKEAVERIKYAPVGMRSMFGSSRAMRVSGLNFKDYHTQANERITLIVQIEGKQGMEDLDRILAMEGVDMISTGRYDISQSIGVPCEADHPKVDEFENAVVQKTLAAGKVPILGGTEKDARDVLSKQEVHMLIVSRDTAVLTNGLNDIVRNLKRYMR